MKMRTCNLLWRAVGSLTLALMLLSKIPPALAQCCGSPNDGKKIKVHLKISVVECAAQGKATLNVKTIGPGGAEEEVIVDREITTSVNDPVVEKISVTFGTEVKVEITDLHFDPPVTGSEFIGFSATLSTPCPDSQTKAASVLIGNGHPPGSELDLSLKVKRPDQTGAAGECLKKLGSVDLSFGMGRIAGGKSAGDIWMEEASITAASYTRRSLYFGRTDGQDGMRVKYDGAGATKALRQVSTPTILANVVDVSATSFEIQFYKAQHFGQLVDDLYQPDRANCFRTWLIDKPAGGGGNPPAQLRVRGYRNGTILIPGSETIYTQETTTNGSETVGLNETAGAPRHEKRNVLILEDNPAIGQQTEIRTFIVTDPAADTVPLTRRIEKLIDGKMAEVREGTGTEEEKTVYNYNATTGKLESTSRFSSAGQLIGYEFTTEYSTFSPFLNMHNARETSLSVNSSTEWINGIQVRHSSIYQGGTQTVQVDDPFGGNDPIDLVVKLTETTQQHNSAWATPLVSKVWTIAADAAIPLLAGKIWQEQGADGIARRYQYKSGNWNGTTFTANITDKAEEETMYEGLVESGLGFGDFIPRNNLTLKRVTVTDAVGNTVAEETSVYLGGGYVPMGKILHAYDDEGHLVLSVRDNWNGRVIYSAVWQDGLKQSETDETGVVTTFGNYDAQGRPWNIVRQGLPVADGLPAIPAQTTNLTYDAAGRKTQESVSGGTSTTTRGWTYDTLGRVKTETVNGLTTNFAYAYNSGGGLIMTKTRPGGATEITTSYMDGRTSSITGTGVLQQIFGYAVNADGTQYQFQSQGTEAVKLWTATTTDWLGRTISQVRPGSVGTVTSTMDYDSAGQLWHETPAGLGQRTHTYNNLDGATAAPASIPANLRTSTVNLSPGNDRSAQTAEYYLKEGAEFFRVTETSRGKVMEKVGHEGSPPADELAKTISVDLRDKKTTTVTTVDRANAKVTQTTAREGIDNSAVTISRLGLAQSVTTFSGGAPALYGYDGFGRQVSSTEPRTGTVTNITYHPVFGSVATITTGTQVTSNIYYNTGESSPPGLLKSRTVNGLTTRFSYDALGRQARVWGGAAYPLWYEYDGNGRLKKLHTYRTGADTLWSGTNWPGQGGAGDVTTWTYFPGTTLLQKKTDAAARAVNYTYFPSGLLQTRIWARNVTTNYTYNGAGELTATDYSDATPDVTLGYNNSGQPISMTDAAGTHILSYDPVGREFTGDAVDATEPGILAGVSLSVGRDAYGRMNGLQVSKAGSAPLGVDQTFTYQPATGRMHTAGDGTNTATYTYLPNSDWLSTTVISRSGLADALTHTRTPDTLGRLQTIAATRGATVHESHTWRYDAAGRRDRDTLADGSYWAYSYNDRSEVTGGVKHLPPAQAEAAARGHAFGYGFDPIGNRKQSTVNGRTAAYTANALNQYAQRTVPPAVDVLGSAAPEAVVQVTGPQGTQTAWRQGTQFSIAVPVDNAAAAQFPVVGISAKRSTVAGGGAVTETESDTSGKLFLAKNPEEYAYDFDGNTLSDGRWDYTWDGENRLKSAETRAGAVAAGVPRVKVEYAYDGRGRRLARTVRSGYSGSAYTQADTRRFLYDGGWNLLAEIDGNGAVVRRCLWGLDLSGSLDGAGGIGGLLVESLAATPGGALTDCLPFYDGNGNITGLVKAADGTEAARYWFGPFGEELGRSGAYAEANPFRWSTKYRDDLTGWKDYGYRWLGDGRWLSRDPLEEKGGYNLYCVLSNSVINTLDLLGLLDLVGITHPDPNGIPVNDVYGSGGVVKAYRAQKSREREALISLLAQRLKCKNYNVIRGQNDLSGKIQITTYKAIFEPAVGSPTSSRPAIAGAHMEFTLIGTPPLADNTSYIVFQIFRTTGDTKSNQFSIDDGADTEAIPREDGSYLSFSSSKFYDKPSRSTAFVPFAWEAHVFIATKCDKTITVYDGFSWQWQRNK